MPIKGSPRHILKRYQTPVGIATEAFNTLDMGVTHGKFIFAVVGPKMLVKADINQTTVAAPTISVNLRCYNGFVFDKSLQ